MNDYIKTIINQAEKESWDKLNSYVSVLEAVKYNRANSFKQRLIEIVAEKCIEICKDNNDFKSSEDIYNRFFK